jgi:AraC-like DNA-binding protein
VRMGVGRMGPTVSHRTRGIVAGDNDDVALLVNLRGPFIIRREGDDLSLGDGDACLIDCCDIGAFVRPAAGELLCLRMPRAMLADFVPSLEAAVGRKIPRFSDPLGLLVNYVSTLSEVDELALLPEASHPVVRHVCDLAALSIGAGRDGAHLAESRGLRFARLKAVKAHINANIGPYPLLIENVAAHHGITARYVRKLFEIEGQSFSNYVTEQRLGRAHALLTRAHRPPEPISSIAYDVGFGDLSYFNRAFRRRFGATPSEVRAEALNARRQVA